LSNRELNMSSAAFACIMILRKEADRESLLNLLSQDRRTEVEAVLEKVKDLPQDQVRAKLETLRSEQLNQQREEAKIRIGDRINHVTPKLFAWLARPF
jgi:hypothetical protein